MKELIPQALVERKIFLIRGRRVMLDRDLAELYKVETRALNQAVKRNLNRFPEDFMFRLMPEEAVELSRSQFVTLKKQGQNIKYLPYAFTENGVAMLSSVLSSERAVEVNVQIMRTFVRLRLMLASNAELARKLQALEKKYDTQFKVVFDAIKQLMKPDDPKKKQIGCMRESGK